jgi:putative ABC transport system permease protein
MILLQALVVGFIGFGLGAGMTGLFAFLNADSTDLSMTLNWQLLMASGAAVLFIVLMAALFSIRKVMKLEPAIVFKG